MLIGFTVMVLHGAANSKCGSLLSNQIAIDDSDLNWILKFTGRYIKYE